MDRYSFVFSLNQVLIQLLLDIDSDNKFISWEPTRIPTLPLLWWELGSRNHVMIPHVYLMQLLLNLFIYIHIKFDNWGRDLNLNISFKNTLGNSSYKTLGNSKNGLVNGCSYSFTLFVHRLF